MRTKCRVQCFNITALYTLLPCILILAYYEKCALSCPHCYAECFTFITLIFCIFDKLKEFLYPVAVLPCLLFYCIVTFTVSLYLVLPCFQILIFHSAGCKALLIILLHCHVHSLTQHSQQFVLSVCVFHLWLVDSHESWRTTSLWSPLLFNTCTCFNLISNFTYILYTGL